MLFKKKLIGSLFYIRICKNFFFNFDYKIEIDIGENGVRRVFNIVFLSFDNDGYWVMVSY